jgi:hypothetical protein
VITAAQSWTLSRIDEDSSPSMSGEKASSATCKFEII